MKKIIYMLLVSLVILSCDNQKTLTSQTIINNSGKNIEIISYKTGPIPSQTTLSKRNVISNSSQLQLKVENYPPDGKIYFSQLVEGDSIVIDYGDKIKIYGQNLTKNPVDGRNPYQLDGKNQSNDFTYTLTPEDYTNAIPK